MPELTPGNQEVGIAIVVYHDFKTLCRMRSEHRVELEPALAIVVRDPLATRPTWDPTAIVETAFLENGSSYDWQIREVADADCDNRVRSTFIADGRADRAFIAGDQ